MTLRACLDERKMGEERKWEERKQGGRKIEKKIKSLLLLGWRRENREERKWVNIKMTKIPLLLTLLK